MSDYRYDLDDDEIAVATDRLAAFADERFPGVRDLIALWVASDDPTADAVRTLENRAFPGIDGFMSASVERASTFLVLLDRRADDDAIVHAMRASGPMLLSPDRRDAVRADDGTGFVMVDEIVESGQGVTPDAFTQSAAHDGLDLDRCFAIETHFRVKDVPKRGGLRPGSLTYIAVFAEFVAQGFEPGRSAVFAHVNEASMRSFQALGVRPEPFLGRADLRSPGAEPGSFDAGFAPVAIPVDEALSERIRAAIPFAAPTARIEALAAVA
jgi:hypothetical protein